MSEHTNPYEPPADDSDGLDAKDLDKLVVLATCDEASVEAHQLKSELAVHNIAAHVVGGEFDSFFGGTIGGFRLQVLVRRRDVDAALRVKNRLASNSETASEIPEWKCKCGEHVDAGFAVCWNCQAEFPGS